MVDFEFNKDKKDNEACVIVVRTFTIEDNTKIG